MNIPDTKLRAFHGDYAIKRKYVERVVEHARADRLVQGRGWDNGKGCAIGCTLEAYDHSRYPVELGLPVWLARLEDSIFEGLPKSEAMKWPISFLRAIKPGVDVEPVRHRLAILRMDRLIAKQSESLAKRYGYGVHEAIELTIAALRKARAYHEACLVGGQPCAAESAESEGRSAALSAWSAAWKQEAADLLRLLRECR